jgi:soluble lytic murein transglycosylase-like protein
MVFSYFFISSKDNRAEASIDKDVVIESSIVLDNEDIRNRIEEKAKEQFLYNFDLELEFWLSIIPNKELVYHVMDNNLGIPKTLIFALVKNESNFYPNAIGRNSTSSDYGLFQLNSITYAHIDPRELLKVENNMSLGIYHLYGELENFNWNISSAVKAYNAGPSRVRNGNVPQSTLVYWSKIKADMENYSKLLAEFYENNF